MNKLILLVIAVGLAAACWLNREKITASLPRKDANEQPHQQEAVAPRAPVTPNPATESVLLARKAYPALAKEGSAFNKRFVALYDAVRQSDPAFLAQPNWPVQLAERAAEDLGGGAMPISGTPSLVTASSPFKGTTLDKKPNTVNGRAPYQLPPGYAPTYEEHSSSGRVGLGGN